ncbi:hypothetical protein H1R20_g5775, partial [Candolleomyces eurysporus]
MATFTWRRRPLIIVFSVLFTTALVYLIAHNRYQIQNTLSYATRPLWDKDTAPNNVISHYYSEGLKFDSHACELHGWKQRKDTSNVKVLDSVLMSSELDLLEIRLNELDSVVDYFLIVESNATFTGLPKETFFANNRDRFSKFAHKIVYRFLPGYALKSGQSAWDVEAHTRNTVTDLLRSRISNFPSGTQTLVLMSDLDEIIADHTVRLLKTCDFGTSIHLQLRDFMYSFEWYLGLTSWRASAQIWRANSYYRHSKSTETILADSGWHCSFCFRTIPEYIMKMKGYSHADRIGGRINLLDPKRIQDIICKGRDIFGMLPEAYSYVKFFSQLNLEPSKSAIGLPPYLLEHSDKFKFLLPGGCQRES